MIVSIDTNILRMAADYSLEHISYMINFNTFNLYLAMDNEELLLGEYQNEVGKNILFQKWFSETKKKSHIYFCSHQVTKKHTKELLQLGFHGPIDLIIVGLAMHADKYIVTEDSDFGKGEGDRAAAHWDVLDYFNKKMGLTIHCASEANVELVPIP